MHTGRVSEILDVDVLAAASEVERGFVAEAREARLARLLDAEALETLNATAVNQYWAWALVLEALRDNEALPLTGAQITAATKRIQAAYPDRRLLELVLSGHFTQMEEHEMGFAKRDGLVVTDETWPIPGDQDKINPVYFK